MRRFLAILSALPLLLPPGMCLCELVQEKCEACAEAEAVTEVATCSCCKHQHAAEAPRADAGLTKGHTCTTSAPDRDDRHVPHCPVKTGGTFCTAHAGMPSACTTVSLAIVEPSSSPPVVSLASPGSSWSSDQHLYLTLLNLRI